MRETSLFQDLEIRNTDYFYSVVSNENYDNNSKIIIIYNDLNESLIIQPQGDRLINFLNPINIGEPIIIPANTKTYIKVQDNFPCLRLKVNCLVSPNSGLINSWIESI